MRAKQASRDEMLGLGPVSGNPNPMEDGAVTEKGMICPNHPYPMPRVAVETKEWLAMGRLSRPAPSQSTEPRKGDEE